MHSIRQKAWKKVENKNYIPKFHGMKRLNCKFWQFFFSRILSSFAIFIPHNVSSCFCPLGSGDVCTSYASGAFIVAYCNLHWQFQSILKSSVTAAALTIYYVYNRTYNSLNYLLAIVYHRTNTDRCKVSTFSLMNYCQLS